MTPEEYQQILAMQRPRRRNPMWELTHKKFMETDPFSEPSPFDTPSPFSNGKRNFLNKKQNLV